MGTPKQFGCLLVAREPQASPRKFGVWGMYLHTGRWRDGPKLCYTAPWTTFCDRGKTGTFSRAQSILVTILNRLPHASSITKLASKPAGSVPGRLVVGNLRRGILPDGPEAGCSSTLQIKHSGMPDSRHCFPITSKRSPVIYVTAKSGRRLHELLEPVEINALNDHDHGRHPQSRGMTRDSFENPSLI